MRKLYLTLTPLFIFVFFTGYVNGQTIICPPDTVIQCGTPTDTASLGSAEFMSACSLGVVFMRSQVGYPWDQSILLQSEMDSAFGAGNWSEAFFETAVAADVFSPRNHVIYMEGGDDGANEMNTFIQANMTLIENWVAAGGVLLMNSAPNEGGNINYGFGGVTLVYPNLIDNVYASDPAHPIWNGPYLPTSDTMTGDSYGHAIICPAALGAVPLIQGSSTDEEILVEANYGSGTVFFGGMTTTNWHSPQPEAFNVKVNLLEYMEANVPSFPTGASARISFTDSIADYPSGSECPVVDTIFRMWTGMDTCGGTYTCVQIITRIDTIAPDASLYCPGDTTITCGESVPVEFNFPPFDGCNTAYGIAVLPDDSSAFSPCGGVILRQYVYNDQCFNMDTCTQTITVSDTIAPTLFLITDTLYITCTDTIPSSEDLYSVSDDCSDSVTVISSEDTVAFNCSSDYTLQRTFTATDNCDNSTSDTIIIRVYDISGPEFVNPPADTTISCGDSIPDPGALAVTDSCTGATYEGFMDYDTITPWTFTQTIYSGSGMLGDTIYLEGPNAGTGDSQAVAYMAAAKAMTLTFNWDYTTEDVDGPGLDPFGYTVNGVETILTSDAGSNMQSGMDTIVLESGDVVSFFINSVDDILGASEAWIYDIEYNVDPLICPIVDCFIRQFEAEDECGNSGYAYQLITIIDTTPPVVICNDTTVECGASVPPLSMITIMDGCDTNVMITFTEDSTGFDGSCTAGVLGTVERTYVATDSCGNTDSCTQTITVIDTTPPAITCPADTVVSCSDTASLGFATATDNCLALVIDSLGVVFMRSQAGYPWNQSILLQSEMDSAFGAGNWSEAFFETAVAADVFSPGNHVIYMEGGDFGAIEMNTFIQANMTLIENWVSAGGVLLMNSAPNEGGNINYGFGGVTLVYPSSSGSVYASDSAHPIWNGPYLPTSDTMTGSSYGHAIICPAALGAVPLIQVLQGASPDAEVLVEANYGSGTVFFGGMTTTNFHSPQPEAFNVKVNLLEYMEANAVGSAPVEVSFTDSIIPGSCPAEMTIMRTFTAIDSCGNLSTCTQTITVIDTTAPVLVFDEDEFGEGDTIYVSCTDTIPSSEDLYFASDNCQDSVPITFTDDTLVFNCSSDYTLHRTFTATDSCGNSTSDSLIIRVYDVSAPEFVNPPADTTISCGDSIPDPGALAVTDSCTGATYEGFMDYDTITPWTFTQTIYSSSGMLGDTIYLEGPDAGTGDSQAVAYMAAAKAMTLTFSWDYTTEDLDGPGFDPFGYTVNGVETILTSDTGLNMQSGMDTIVLESGDVVSFFINAIDDSFGAAEAWIYDIEYNVNPLECPVVDCFIRQFEAEDECGNSGYAYQLITIIDTTPPVVICSDTTVECGASVPPLSMITIMDGCDTNVLITFTEDSTGFDGSCTAGVLGTVERTYVATDSCGNTDSCTQTITVIDTTPPAITCPSDTVVSCTADTSTVSLGIATATDNCVVIDSLGVVFMRSQAGYPWNQSILLQSEMDSAFGAGNWSEAFFETAVATDVFSPGNHVIYMEGGDDGAIEMDAFIQANMTLIENWVDAGGVLLMNSAPNEGGNINYGFGGVTLVYPNFINSVYASDPAHPIWNGPYLPTSDTMTGSSYGHAIICPAALGAIPLIQGLSTDEEVLVEANYGSGTVFFGGMTTTNFHSPQPEAFNVKVNLLEYLEASVASIAISYTDSIIPGSCASEYTIARTFSAADNCGNLSTCTQTITVIDTTPPMIVCPADTVVDCEIGPDTMFTGMAIAMDECGGVGAGFFIQLNEIHYDNEGTDVNEFIEVAGTAGTDLSGYDIVLYNGSTGSSYNIMTLSGTIDDEGAGFGAVAFTYPTNGIQNGSPDGFALVDNTTNAVIEFLSYEGTLTASDGPAAGMVSTDIGVQETSSTPVGMSLQRSGGPGSSWYGPSADNPDSLNSDQIITPPTASSTVTVTYTDVSTGTCPDTIMRTFVATDDCGNSDSCTQTIIVIDTVAPIIVCPPDTLVACGNTSVDSTGMPTVSDNCSGGPIVQLNEIHYDDSGTDENEAIEVAGTAGTDLSDYDIVLYNGFNGTVYNTMTLSGTIDDEGSGFGAIFFSYPTNGIQNGSPDGFALVDNTTGTVIEFLSYEGTFTAASGPAAGMTSTDIGVEESFTTEPTESLQRTNSGWTGPITNTMGTLNAGQSFMGIIPPGITLTIVDDSSSFNICGGSIFRTFTATDECGNSSSCTQTITVNDTVPPVFTFLPMGDTISCEEDLPDLTAVAEDDCDSAVVTMTVDSVQGDCPQEYTVTVNYTATDVCDNTTTATVTFEIIDETYPELITGLPDVTITCDEPTPTGFPVYIDNCGEVTITLEETFNADTSCPQQGTLFRDFMACDECGNCQFFRQEVTIIDEEPPVITFVHPELIGLPSGVTLTYECNSNDTGWVVPTFDESAIEVSDNCSDSITVTQVEIEMVGECETDGYFRRVECIFYAEDECGNIDSVWFFVEIVDTESPMIMNVPEDTTIACSNSLPEYSVRQCDGTGEIVGDEIVVVDSCECGTVSVTVDTLGGGCSGSATVLRTWTATDNCGNSSSATQTITIVDTTGPAFEMLRPELENYENGETSYAPCDGFTLPRWMQMLDDNSVRAVDECTGQAIGNVTFEHIVEFPPNCEIDNIVQLHTFRWTATDPCGNIGSFTIYHALIDLEAPELIGFEEVVCGEAVIPEAVDNCGSVILNVDQTSRIDTCTGQEVTVMVYSAEDACGNEVVAEQIVLEEEGLVEFEIEDEQLSGVEFGDTLKMSCEEYSDFDPESGSVSIAGAGCYGVAEPELEVITLNDENCSGEVNYEYRWTSTGVCGAEQSISIYVSVLDEEAPVWENYLALITIDCGEPMPEIVVEDDCGDVEIIEDVLSDTCEAGRRIIMRRVTLIDQCENENVYEQEIILDGEQGIEIEGLPQAGIVCGPVQLNLSAVDLCTGLPLEVETTETTMQICPPATRRVISYSVEGVCAENVTGELVVIEGAEEPPVLAAAAQPLQGVSSGGTIEVDCDISNIDLTDSSVEVTGGCGEGAEVEMSRRLVMAADCEMMGFKQRWEYIWTASDVCGNTSTWRVLVEVVDEEAPEIMNTFEEELVVCGAPEPIRVFAFDNCEGLMEVEEFTDLVIEQTERYTLIRRRWIVSDECGNTSFADQMIRLVNDLASGLACEIINPQEEVLCNSDGNVLVGEVEGGSSPYSYEWEVTGGVCFITGGQGTPEITYSIGFSRAEITLTITDHNGCVAICTYEIVCEFDKDGDGTGGIGLVIDPVLYPNPTSGISTLSGEFITEGKVTVDIIDPYQRVRKRYEDNVKRGRYDMKIDLSDQPAGVYMIRITDAEGNTTILNMIKGQ